VQKNAQLGLAKSGSPFNSALDCHKMNTELIGIDSQCVSYVIDAMQNITAPNDSPAPEKIANHSG